MPTVSVRVPEELKAEMEQHDEINWSAVIRRHLEAELADLDRRNVANAVATSERLSGRIDETAVADENTAALIREFRDSRYGGESA